MTLHVTKCHACHAKDRGVTGDQRGPSASQEPAQRHKCHACHTKGKLMSPSATPATPHDTGCHQVPRLPRKRPRPATSADQARHKSQPSAISAKLISVVCVCVSCVRELCVNKLCVCVKVLCVSRLCVSKLCVRELCVCV